MIKSTRFIAALLVLCPALLAAAPNQTKPAAPSTVKASPAPAKVTLPAAVSAAFRKAYPRATIKTVSKEGGTYEVESLDGTQRRDLIYRPDGTVVLYEELVSESDVPAPVLTAIKARYPKATFTAFEKLFRDSTMNYEVVIKNAGKSLELELTPVGRWISPKAAQ